MPGDIDPVALFPEPEFDEHAGRAALAGVYLPGDPDLLGLPRPTFGVTRGGLAALHAAGGRAPRRAADASVVADARTRHNWRPTGPRNVTGRVRALAADPRDPNVFYAGTASGGVYKTTNGGERWFPLWHDEPSLAVGAIAVATASPADPARRRVYAATGEIEDNGFPVPGHGIWVSDNGGADWTNRHAAVPPPANPVHRKGFDAIAVDPANDDHCWAVGGDGIYRTSDAGATWRQFLAGTHISDVAFSDGRIYLARATSAGGEAAVLRVDPPASTAGATDAAITAALASADALSIVIAALAPDALWPARLKLAVAPSDRDVAYVRVADENGDHLGVFRSRNARVALARNMTWQRLADHPDFFEEEQGTYNLCIAVSPANANHLATGMVSAHVSANANAAAPTAVNWRRAIAWELYTELRGWHADNHQLIVAGPALFVANDGGIARSLNWVTGQEVNRRRPLAPGSIVFRRCDGGISASQAYDLNQSPLVATMYAAGFQDNGVHMTGGGPTWRNVFGGDGGFVVFDPDDPFRFLITWQGGIESLQFPGHLDRLFPGEQVSGIIPEPRSLRDGFKDIDQPAFVADTDRHARATGRLLHTRRNRLYGTRGATGERWAVEDVGTSFDLVVTDASDTADIEILPTDGAVRLGLIPGRKLRRRVHDPLTDTRRVSAVARISSRLPAPYRLADGDELRFRVGGAEHVARFRAADVTAIAAVSLAESLRIIRAVLPASVQALPRLWPTNKSVDIITRGRGAGQQITIGGSALAAQPDGLSRLGLNAGTYRGDADRPASITLGFEGLDEDERAVNRNLSGAPALELTVAVNGGAVRTIRFETPTFADPARITAGELEAALQTALVADADAVDVVAGEPFKAVLVEAEPGRSVVVRGTASDRLGIAATSATAVLLGEPKLSTKHRRLHRRNFASVDLTSTGAPLALEITDGTTSTGPLPFTAADVADLRCVTVEELHRLVRTRIAATPGIRVRVELVCIVDDGQAREVRFSTARPDEAWVGGDDGRVFRTIDNGANWTPVGIPAMRIADGRVEAIALHPSDSQVAYVGVWRFQPGPADRPLLFRTRDGAGSWQPIGSARVGGTLTGIVAGGAPLSIHALELDPADPAVVFAATEAGVFRSADGGDTWAPLNEGLPNCRIVDLAVVSETRSLRAALWGRGMWERSLAPDPPDDIRLVVRSNELDDGRARPSRLAPRLFADAPGPDPLHSPDIKVIRRRPSFIGADPNVDGVEFDLDTPVDEVVPGAASELLVQVHNRGSFPARSLAAAPPPPAPDHAVRVVIMWAAVHGDLPSLPLDFWGRLKAGPIGATEGGWNRMADARLPGDLPIEDPAVVSTAFAWPDPIDAPEVAVLLIVTGTDDVLDGGPTDVGELVHRERRAALRRFPVRRAADDRTLMLRSRGRRFQVTNRPAPATAMAARLDIAPAALGTLGSVLTAGAHAGPTYDLSGTEPGLVVAEEPVTVGIEFHNDDGEFADIAHASPAEAARFVGARLAQAGVNAFAAPGEVGIRLRASGGALVRVTGGTAAAAFGWAAMPVAASVATLDARNVNWFDLQGDRELRLEVRAQANHPLTVPLPSRAFDQPQFASPERVALILNRAIRASRLDGVLRCDVIRGVTIGGRGEARVTAAGAAATTLGLPAGAERILEADPGEVSLAGRPHMTVTVENQVTVRFDRDPDHIPAPATAAPPDVRRVLNEAFEIAEMDVRAEVPYVSLSVSASPSERGGGARTGGGHLADLATSGTAAAPDPPGLFDVRTALGADRLKAGVANQLYARIRNAGNIDAAPARLRLFVVDPTTTPVGVGAPPAVDVNQAVASGVAAVAAAAYTPAAAAGGFEHLLAVVDQDVDGRRVTLPVFADLLALVAFCESRLDVAMRTFEVGA